MKFPLKKLLLLANFIACGISCEVSPKLTSLVLPLKEIFLSPTESITEVSFLYIIDTSGSMSKIRKTFSMNTEKFLNVAMFYPYYNYNFAMMTMSPLSTLDSPVPLFLAPQGDLAECGLENLSDFIETTALGQYIRYTTRDLESQDYKKLLCLLSTNIMKIGGGSGTVEMYFEPIDYILDHSDPNFSARFFGPDNFLSVLFISNAYGDDLADRMMNLQADNARDTGSQMGDNLKKRLESLKEPGSFKFYAAVPLENNQDSCVEDNTRPGIINQQPKYPHHVYRIIETTKGKAISICDKNWGAELQTISKDIQSSFQHRVIMFEDIPKIDTIEVFYNDYKLPKDADEGWSYNPETVSIYIGDQFFPSKHDNEGEQGKFKIRYYPLNPELAAGFPEDL